MSQISRRCLFIAREREAEEIVGVGERINVAVAAEGYREETGGVEVDLMKRVSLRRV